jgi:hypothetical protein
VAAAAAAAVAAAAMHGLSLGAVLTHHHCKQVMLQQLRPKQLQLFNIRHHTLTAM